MAEHGFRGAVVSLLDPAGQANAWSVRKAGLSLLLSKRGDVKPAGFMEDVAVPPEHLADYVRNVQQMFAEYGKRRRSTPMPAPAASTSGRCSTLSRRLTSQ